MHYYFSKTIILVKNDVKKLFKCKQFVYLFVFSNFTLEKVFNRCKKIAVGIKTKLTGGKELFKKRLYNIFCNRTKRKSF